jgi:uncharacterized repeat protein (TIGR03803 family)
MRKQIAKIVRRGLRACGPTLAGLFSAILACGALLQATLSIAQATDFQTIYAFKGRPNDGTSPVGMISAGKVLYGATTYGGQSGGGTVFSLTLPANAGDSPTEQILYNIPNAIPDVIENSGVVLGSGGVLYGTTYTGGLYHYGTVYSVTPPASAGGEWTPATIYNFSEFDDAGGNPQTGVVVGAGGVLYGTTTTGSSTGNGAIYSLTPPVSPGGAWSEAVIFSFPDQAPFPNGLVIGKEGVLYGTTAAYSGSENGYGTVFSLAPPASHLGAWTFTVLYAFQGGSDGDNPSAVVMGNGGVLYGATNQGGLTDNGTVFSLTPPESQGGAWTKTTIYNSAGGVSPTFPVSVVIGKGGELYITSADGGTSGDGTVFSLTPPASPGGPWSETVLHSFAGAEEGYPVDAVVGEGGVLYGCTSDLFDGQGGGTVFALKP